MRYWIMLLGLAIVLVPSYVAAYLTGEMVWVVPTLVASGLVAAGVNPKTPTTRVDEDGDPGDDGDDGDNGDGDDGDNEDEGDS